MNGLLPYTLNVSGFQKRVWLSCDTATKSQYRGRGLFKACVQELETSLDCGDLILGFPNANSLPGFLKQGWQIISEIKIFVSPRTLFCPKNLQAKKISPEKISEDFLGFGDFNKSAEYLKWRYSRLRDDYQIYEINLNQNCYIVVTKVMKIKKISFTLILDIFTNQSKIDESLIKSLRCLAAKQKTIGILTSSLGLNKKALILNLLFKLPNVLNSRRIFLAGKVIGDNDIDLKSSIKELTLGDFDAI